MGFGFSQSASTSTPATSITYNSADVSGFVDDLNTGSYDCYFYYKVTGTSTWSSLAASPSSITNGTGSQAESVNITGLTASTTYDYVMILEDPAGGFNPVKANGSVETFTTLSAPTSSTPSAASITQNEATITGGGNAEGNGTYSTVIGYKKASDFNYTFVAGTPSTISGTSQTAYTSNLSGLDANTQYTIVSALYESSTKVSESTSSTFTTLALAAPSVSTGAAANIDYYAFDVNGNNVTDDGGDAITEQGLVYSTVNNPPTTADSKQTYTPLGEGAYDVSLSSLSAGTTYYVRAYAINSTGTSYGSSTVTQATSSSTAPTVTIPATIDNITKIGADNTGNNATDENGASITDKGICWNTASNPNISDDAYSSGATGTGTYNGVISSLSAGTKYYVKAYACNSAGDGYSAERNFITDTDDPALLGAASNIHANDFDADWSSTTGAQGYYLDVATDVGFTAMVSGYNNLDVGNVTHKVVSGLTANTEYFYRIRAYHDGGDHGVDFTSGNSGANSVTTLEGAPTTQVSNMKWETINDGKTMSFNWSDGNGDGNMLIMKANSSVTDPSGGDSYNANAHFGDGDNILATGTYVVFNSTHAKGTSTVDVTGLTTGTTYYFKGLEYNGSGSTINYNTDATAGFNVGNSGSTALPVELLSFKAENKDGKVLLKWQTATELNNDYFIIERSTDAENFLPIAKIQGAGNSNIILSYSYVDENSISNTVMYYRLRQVDFDGKTEIFPTVSITIEDKSSDISSLNIDYNTLVVNYNNPSNNHISVSLLDINGRVLQMAISDAEGQQSMRFDLSALSRGMYFVNMEQDGKITTRKFIY